MTDKAREIMQHCEIVLVQYGPNAGKLQIKAKRTPAGKRLYADIARGLWRAEIEEIKAQLNAEKAAKEAADKARQNKIEAIEGLKEIRAAINAQARYREELVQMMEDEDNDGIRPPKRPDPDIAALKAKYPRAAAYIKAENYSCAEHYAKADAGRAALEKIINGGDFAQAIADMEHEWSAYCRDHIWD